MGTNLSAAGLCGGGGMKAADVAAQTVKSTSYGLLHKSQSQTAPPPAHLYFFLKRDQILKASDERHKIFVTVILRGLPRDADAPTESHRLLVTHIISSGESRLTLTLYWPFFTPKHRLWTLL